MATVAQLLVRKRAEEDLNSEGGGLIVGVSEDRIYIATADHLVYDRRARRPFDEIQVEFRQLPGENYEAVLPPVYRNINLDLALIAVDRHRYPELDFVSDLVPAAAALAKRPADLRVVGHPRANLWQTFRNPIPVMAETPEYLLIEGQAIKPGHSGGGAFDADWRLAGLVIEIDRGLAKVLKVTEISRELTEASAHRQISIQPISGGARSDGGWSSSPGWKMSSMCLSQLSSRMREYTPPLSC